MPGAEVTALDGATLGPVLTEAATRYRMYADLPPATGVEDATWLSLHGGAVPLGEVLADATISAATWVCRIHDCAATLVCSLIGSGHWRATSCTTSSDTSRALSRAASP